MGNPTSQQIEAAVKGMREDASSWTVMAMQLASASGTARRITLSHFAFSGWAVLAGMDDTYDQVREKLTSLLDQAATTFENIGDAISKAADDYERDEEQNAHKMQNIY